MQERWIRAALAAALASLISTSACGGSGDDDTGQSPNGSSGSKGSSGSSGSKNDAGAQHGSGGSHAADAGGSTKPPPNHADASTGSDAGAASERDLAAASFCHADCERAARCAKADDGCEPACITMTERWGEAFLSELAACVEQSSCDDEDGSCYGNALSELHPDFADDPAVGHCAELSQSCDFDENLCPSLLVLVSEAQDAAMDCLSLECKDDVAACLTSEGAFSP